MPCHATLLVCQCGTHIHIHIQFHIHMQAVPETEFKPPITTCIWGYFMTDL